jgi:hypothetical protein
LACLDANVGGILEISIPHLLQKDDALEFCVLQFGHFLCFRFFFSKANVTVSRLFSALKLSSGIQEISVLRFPESRNKDSTARALNRKYSHLMVLAWFNALFSSLSSITVSRFSLKLLFLIRVNLDHSLKNGTLTGLVSNRVLHEKKGIAREKSPRHLLNEINLCFKGV